MNAQGRADNQEFSFSPKGIFASKYLEEKEKISFSSFEEKEISFSFWGDFKTKNKEIPFASSKGTEKKISFLSMEDEEKEISFEEEKETSSLVSNNFKEKKKLSFLSLKETFSLKNLLLLERYGT